MTFILNTVSKSKYMLKFFVRGILLIAFGILFSITAERDHNTPQGVLLMAFIVSWMFEPFIVEALLDFDKKYGKSSDAENKSEK